MKNKAATSTLSEVAHAAGVSTAAVAKVMYNSRGNTRVGREKAELIRKIAAEMNLAPNPAARALRTGKTRMIGFLNGGTPGEIRVRTMTELTNKLEEKGYQLIFHPSNRYEAMHQYAEKLAANCDALVVDASFIKERFPAACNGKILLLTSDERAEELNYPMIRYGHTEGVREAIKFLYDKGHRKIVMFSINWWHNKDNARVRTFEKCASELALEYAHIEYLAENISDVTSCQISELLKKHSEATAVFCVCDMLALRVMQVAQHLGINIPRDLSVVGFDDIAAAELAIPPLTTVRQPNEEIASEAVKYLMNLLENGQENVSDVQPCRLVVRESVDVPKSQR